MTREEVIELLSDIRSGFNCFDPMEQQQYHALSKAIEALKAQDTSREQVVRCKDCVYWATGTNEEESWEYCYWFESEIDGNEFCSYGERKDGNGDE